MLNAGEDSSDGEYSTADDSTRSPPSATVFPSAADANTQILPESKERMLVIFSTYTWVVGQPSPSPSPSPSNHPQNSHNSTSTPPETPQNALTIRQERTAAESSILTLFQVYSWVVSRLTPLHAATISVHRLSFWYVHGAAIVTGVAVAAFGPRLFLILQSTVSNIFRRSFTGFGGFIRRQFQRWRRTIPREEPVARDQQGIGITIEN